MVERFAPVLLVALVSVGCATTPMRFPGPTRHMRGTPGQAESSPQERKTSPVAERSTGKSTRGGRRVAASAAALVGKSRLHTGGTTYRYDCSGFVDAAHARAGVDLGSRNAAALYDLARKHGVYTKKKHKLRVGDTVFFDNTHDRNRNGRQDDRNTHVAIVERLDSDGTAHLVHLGSKGVTRMRMNLAHPGVFKNPAGKEWNSFLRARKGRDPRHTPYMSGQLWSGTASLWAVSTGIAQYEEGAQDQRIELALAPGTDGIMGGADDGLLVSVEAGVHQGG
jgi:hypothetical protein